MNQKEIKDGMGNGEWVAQEDAVTLYTTHDGNRTLLDTYFSMATHIEDVHNCDAICHAINNTYGKNIDPTKVPEMYALLERILSISDIWLPTAVDVEHEGEAVALTNMAVQIKQILNEAKLK